MAPVDVSTPKGLEEFNKHLEDKSYVGGYVPSKADAEVFGKVSAAPDAKKLPHVSRWYNHMKSFSASEQAAWGGASSAAPAATSAPAAPKAEEEFDLFGEGGEEEETEWEKEIERRAAEALAKKAASGKAPIINKSAVVIDVKPWDDTTDMKELEKCVRSVTREGLEWKAGELKPAAYGLNSYRVSCHIVDDLVSIEDVTEEIESYSDYVQSTDIITFTKL